MNLNEECLLQFLQGDNPTLQADEYPPLLPAADGSLTADLRRILRRKHYVSFPPAILIRRSKPAQ